MEQSAMPITDVFGIPGACVVAGKITEGSFSVGDKVTLIQEDGSKIETSIKGIEVGLGKKCDTVEKGQNVSIQLNGVNKADVKPGAILKKD